MNMTHTMILSNTREAFSRLKTRLMQHTLQRPHPGVLFGRYPGSVAERSSGLNAFIENSFSRVAGFISAHATDDKPFIDAILEQGRSLERMDERILDAHIRQVRTRLHQHGLIDDNLISAFALIREVSRRVLSMSHFRCQLQAGHAMISGKIVEMQTGEGKTLTATLPAACAALAGIPVHLVTSNDYLVERDHELMSAVYRRLGLSSDFIIAETDDDRRREIYGCDIVYCTAQQLVFDYLKDRIVRRPYESDGQLRLAPLYATSDPREHLLLRGLNFAVIDEADSVLIDEARTPLILSRQTSNTVQESVNREAVWLARQLDAGKHFVCQNASKQVDITHEGEVRLVDLTSSMHGVWRGERRRNMLVCQALSALHNFKRDIDYIVLDDKVVIIDENTGRPMPDRSWEAGLHQMIEEKEECEQTGINETIARISYQRFFARYHMLAGMTGTIAEVSSEIKNIYGMSMQRIQTNTPTQRHSLGETVLMDRRSKHQYIADRVDELQRQGRPVLIGTRTLEESEAISEDLTVRNLKHRLLNAKDNQEEADIVARAGQSGRVTIATNMAGRGTDIALTDTARDKGGLHVICSDRNMSSRIDRQLFGRCARQGDPGSYESIVSLDDEIIPDNFAWMIRHFRKFFIRNDRIEPGYMVSRVMDISQRINEIKHRRIRKAMTRADERRDSMMAFSGKNE